MIRDPEKLDSRLRGNDNFIMNIVGTYNNLSGLQKILVTLIVTVVAYSLSTGISYGLLGGFKSGLPGSGLISSVPGPATSLEEDPNEPKTEECPLDGGMHTKKAKEAWEKRRPLAVMVENHTEARPQSGLGSADIVYEAVAEGGITRFMAVFYCNLSDIQVGPVRSARTYFLDWQGEYDSLYAHVGGANTPGPADALSQIIKYKVKDLNQFSIGFPVFWRDYQRLGHPVATEHTMYSTTQKLWEIGAKRGWTNVDEDGKEWKAGFTPWKFKDDKQSFGADAPKAGVVTNISVTFWGNQGSYDVNWVYDSTTNSYKRKNGGADHTDLNSKKQIEARNVIIQFERESRANDGYEGNLHLLYGTSGSGKALIFQDGNVIDGKWNKASRLARTKYTDSKGKEIELNRGAIWIQTVPEGSKVSY